MRRVADPGKLDGAASQAMRGNKKVKQGSVYD